MLENIKITANNINTANNNLNRPKMPEKPETLSPFDILDPNIVNKSLKQEGASLNNQENIAYNPYSIAEKFVQSLDSAPTLLENIKKIFFSKQFVNSNIKNNPLLKAFFAEFVKDISMDNYKMLEFLKFQHNNYTKFTGEFFDVLRDCLNVNPNDELKDLVGVFLKSYDNFTSVEETTKALENILRQITDNLPDVLKETFTDMTGKLILDNPENSADINLNLLKNEIIPYLSKYISKTNDFGIVRDYISVLVHNIVKLENGLRDNFTNSADNLLNYLRFSFNLSEKDLTDLKYALISSFRANSALKNNSLDYMFKLVDTGIQDNQNYVNKTTFESMEESLLISNNVQIPLIHIFLPVNFNGVFMFSELWISKGINNNDESSGSDNNQDNQVLKMFLTFDIENLGYFETIIYSQNNKLSLELFVPIAFAGAAKKIKQDITDIVKKNNLSISNIYINECIKPRKFNEVFNTKFIKERGINVIA